MKPLVTIVIPARKIDEQLKRCVRSVQRSIGRSGQRNIEILVVLNKQSKPVEILPCKVLIANRNVVGKTALNRNIGIESAKADLVAFIDSDCVAEMEWVKELLKSSRDLKKHRAVFGVQGNPWLYLQGSLASGLYSEYKKRRALRAVSGEFIDLLNTRNLLIKRNLARKFKFNTSIRLTSDRELLSRLKMARLKLLFNPQMKVKHEALGFTQIWNRVFHYGESGYLWKKNSFWNVRAHFIEPIGSAVSGEISIALMLFTLVNHLAFYLGAVKSLFVTRLVR